MTGQDTRLNPQVRFFRLDAPIEPANHSALVKTECPGRVPIPLQRRWNDVRVRVLPLVLLAAAATATALLWVKRGPATTFVGQAEPVLANVTAYKAGVIDELKVGRFERVKAGEIIGRVMTAEPPVVASSLAVIQSEIQLLRQQSKPVLTQQRTAMNYDQLRLDWMRERAQLASAKVDLGLAQSDYSRMDALFKDKVISERVFEQAKAKRDRLQEQTAELTRLVDEGDQGFQSLQLTNHPEISKVSSDPLAAQLAVEESKLRLTEAQLAPIPLRAPIDGIVTAVYHRAGEAITAGQPILGIATLEPVRIVGYIRPPIETEPHCGMTVEVRTRGLHEQVAQSRIIEVGSQFEKVPPTLLGPTRFANIETGLPVDISLPSQLRIRPGELVDIRLVPKLE